MQASQIFLALQRSSWSPSWMMNGVVSSASTRPVAMSQMHNMLGTTVIKKKKKKKKKKKSTQHKCVTSKAKIKMSRYFFALDLGPMIQGLVNELDELDNESRYCINKIIDLKYGEKIFLEQIVSHWICTRINFNVRIS